MSSEEDAAIETKYEDRISVLPKVKGALGIDLFLYQGFYYRNVVLQGLMCMQHHFLARSSDFLIASFPKSGTTWLKALVFATINRHKYKKETHPLLTKVSHDCIQSLEQDIYRAGDPTISIDKIPSPRIFNTHIPYTSLPKSVIDNDCKIIYICRNVKDVVTSCYQFLSKIIPQVDDGNQNEKDTVENFYDLFLRGICPYGSYWDNVLSYWKVNMERPESILFLKYEDIKRDPHFHVKKLAEFIGHPFSLEEEGKGMVQHIVNLCSFEFLQSLQVNKTGKTKSGFKNDAFYRKGEVGDWKNFLTLDVANQLDQITKEKFDDQGFTF